MARFADKRIFRFRYPVSLIEPAYYWLDVKPKFLKWFLSFAPLSFFLFEVRFFRDLIFKMSVNERIAENPFVLARLPKPSADILDFGATSSWLSLQLASLGHKVRALDMRPYEFSHPNIDVVMGDLFETGLPKEKFDAVLVISTLEHVGLDENKYGKNADRRALSILADSLKKGGILILTVPYGKPAVLSSHRVYSRESLAEAVPPGLFVKEARYYKKVSSSVWLEDSEEESAKADSSKESGAVACLFLQKN